MSLNMSKKLHQKWDPKKVQNEIAGLRHFLPGMVFFWFFLACFCMGVGGPWVFFGLLLGLLLVSWEVHGRKNVKNPGFFQVLWRHLFVSLKPLMVLLSLSWCVLYVYLDCVQNSWSKLCFKTALLPCFFCSACMVRIFTNKKKMDKFGFYFGAYLGYFLWFILGPDWLQKGQDEPNRVIRSYKDPNHCVFKNLKKPSFFIVFGSRGFPREPQDAAEGF